MANFGNNLEFTIPSDFAVNITTATATFAPCRGVYVGISQQFDFNINGSWIPFNNLPAGVVLPIRAAGARDSGDAAPDSGQIIFLY